MLALTISYHFIRQAFGVPEGSFVRICMFIVLLNGIYCFSTRMTNVKTKVMALSAWPRTWLTPVRVHVPTKILKWILVRAVGGAAVRVVGDGARGGGSR